MPTYEYECKICGHRFEAFQGMSDKPIEKCPKCSSPVKRLISGGAGIIFSARGGSAYGGKGSGFYQTDYKNKSSGGKTSCPEKDKNNPACGCCG